MAGLAECLGDVAIRAGQVRIAIHHEERVAQQRQGVAQSTGGSQQRGSVGRIVDRQAEARAIACVFADALAMLPDAEHHAFDAARTQQAQLVRQELAEQACRIEIDLLREPVGKQDQYIASFGGITCFQFLPDDRVEVAPLKLESETLANLEDNLLLFFTGVTRSASAILEEQDSRTRLGDADMISQLHLMKQLGCESKTALEQGNLRRFAELMHVHWEHKKARSRSMTNAHIDEYYALARRSGALGGKLIGAGGGGFLMLYTEDKTRLRHTMRGAGLREVRVRFDFQGTAVLAQS